MILKLNPIYLEKLWGGKHISKLYNINSEKKYGEVFGVSGLKSQSNIIVNSAYQGYTLEQLYKKYNKELFGGLSYKEFPILIKIINADKPLSIQVHPDNAYAIKNYDSYGKYETWYVLNKEGNTDIYLDTICSNLNEFKNSLKENTLLDKLKKVSTEQHDMFDIPPGTVHSLTQGHTVLEIQQSSDLTFRIYDFNRLVNGQKRELHLNETYEVLNFDDLENKINNQFYEIEIKENISKINTAHKYGDYIYIEEGEGLFDEVSVKKGDFLFVPSLQSYYVCGNFRVVKVQIKEETV